MNEVVYLYGFVPAHAPAPSSAVAGVGDAAVRLLDLGEVQAVVSDLPAAIYAADVVESRLQDLGWVGEQGMAHERVVVWFADHSDILPARLFSLYSADDALRTAADARMGEVAAGLRSLSGRREWNLKVAWDAADLARHASEISPELSRMEDEIMTATPGKRYLLERRRSDLLKQELGRAARALANRLLDELAKHAVDTRVLPLTDSDDAGTVVLNAALLVTRDAEDGLRSRAAELYPHYTALGMIVSFSGPWAPYRFVDVYGDS
jgi:hypothetical protein